MKHPTEKAHEVESPRNVLWFAAAAIATVLMIITAVVLLFSEHMPIVQE